MNTFENQFVDDSRLYEFTFVNAVSGDFFKLKTEVKRKEPDDPAQGIAKRDFNDDSIILTDQQLKGIMNKDWKVFVRQYCWSMETNHDTTILKALAIGVDTDDTNRVRLPGTGLLLPEDDTNFDDELKNGIQPVKPPTYLVQPDATDSIITQQVPNILNVMATAANFNIAVNGVWQQILVGFNHQVGESRNHIVKFSGDVVVDKKDPQDLSNRIDRICCDIECVGELAYTEYTANLPNHMPIASGLYVGNHTKGFDAKSIEIGELDSVCMPIEIKLPRIVYSTTK
jgi:hypothetical protein